MERNLLLESYLKRLKLPAITQNYLAVAREAAERNQGYVDYLLALMEQEINRREEQGFKRRLKSARLPFLKTLEEYDFSLIPSLNKTKVLAACVSNQFRPRETGL